MGIVYLYHFPIYGLHWMAVIVGGVAYSVLVLKLDRQICNDLRKIVEGMGIGVIWPGWL